MDYSRVSCCPRGSCGFALETNSGLVPHFTARATSCRSGKAINRAQASAFAALIQPNIINVLSHIIFCYFPEIVAVIQPSI